MINVYEVTKFYRETQSVIRQGDIVRLRNGGAELGEAEGWWGAYELGDGVDYTVAGIDKQGDLLINTDKKKWLSPFRYAPYLFNVVEPKSKVSIPKFKAGDTVVVTAEGHAKGVEASWYSAPALDIGSRHVLIESVGPHSVSIDLGSRPSLGLLTAYYNAEVFELVDDAKEAEYVSDKLLVREYYIKQLEKENTELRVKLEILQENILVFEKKQREDAKALNGLRDAIEGALCNLKGVSKD